jgi:hypothetical protein
MDPAGARELAKRIAEEEQRRVAAAGSPADGDRGIEATDISVIVERLQAELESLRSDVEARDDAIARLRMELTDLRAKAAALDGSSAEAAADPTRGAGAPDHLLFVSQAAGYTLVPRDGAVPPVGSEVHLPDAADVRYRVCKVGPSPFPGDPRRCAFLEPTSLRASD